MKNEPKCTILKEYLEMEKEEGVTIKEATKEQIDRHVPTMHQTKFLRCGSDNARSCRKTDCTHHVDNPSED